jgi:ATP-binding cassette subfamily E protein 1
LTWPELEKSFTNFKLKVSSGDVHKGEVLAVMGANGLGKTTFLKMLSGLIKPDKGEMGKIKIAYKEQYPSSDVTGTVGDWLRKIGKDQFSSGWYQGMLQKLDILRLLDEEVKNLSGGELQKVYIAATLSQDVPIMAFDEPSAFIDVEDRLKVAEVIKDFVAKKEICAIVVDHDVQFIDYIADSMLVFEGNPGKEGHIYGPTSKKDGMNAVLKMLDITYRVDRESGRRRVNKAGSQLDRVQKKEGKYFYI